MSMNPLNDLSAVYMQEVLKPQLGKGSAAGPTKKVEKGKTDVESSAKRIRQAVYDIRYRARREDIKLDQAFTQYMGHTTMTGPEKSAVKEKLGIGPGGGSDVKEEMEEKKFKVRVKDKESGSSYVRYATREKINQLRSNPNISSVEMTGYGEPYEGEKKKGKATAAVTSGKGLAKKDYDGDGKIESGAKEYRGAIHNAIQKKKGGKPDGKDTSSVKEGFSNWREDLFEVMDDVEANKKIKEKKVNNKIVVNPSIKETVEELGGTLIEMVEIDEIDFIVESVYTELLDEGYVEDDIEDAIEYALVEAKVTYGHDTKEPESGGSRLLRAVGRLARQKLKSAKKKATHAVAKAQVSAYNKGREVAQSAAEKGRKAKKSIKSAIGKAARKVADRMSEETEIDEESYMDYAKRKAAERKDTRMTVTAADKKGNTKAYQNYKAGDKRYKAAAGVDEEFEIEEGMTMKDFKKQRSRQKQKDKRAADKIAPNRRKDIHTDRLSPERAARHRVNVDPDFEGNDERNYPGGKLKNPKKIRKAKALGELGEQTEIQEKALSRAQQRFMGMVYAAKKGETPASPEVAKAASGISRKAARDFAKTKHAKLPEKKVEEAVTQMPGRETTPPAETTAKQDDVQKKQVTNAADKQKLANLKMMQQKQQMLQRQKLNLQKQGKLPLNTEEVEIEEGKAIGGVRSTDVNAKGAAARVSSGRGMTMTKASGLGKDKAIKNNPKADDLVKKHYDAQAKADRRAAAKERASSGDDKVSKLIRSVQKNSYQPEGDQLNELNRVEKETGINTKTGKPTAKGGAKDDKAFTSVKKTIRKMEGTPAGQRKKVPGKKPPAAGQYGAPKSPAQKVAMRRAAAQRAQDNMSSRFD